MMAKLSRDWIAGAFLITGVAWYYLSQDKGYSDEDIAQTKESIRKDWESRQHARVVDIQLFRKSSRELVGFVRLKFPGVGDDLTKTCTATLLEQDNSFWECK